MTQQAAFGRRIAAAVLAFVVLAPHFVALRYQITGHTTTLGFTPDYDAVVHAVAAHSPAQRAGIVPHDRIDLAGTPIEYRRYATNTIDSMLAPGTPVQLRVVHHGIARDVILHAAPQRHHGVSLFDDIGLTLANVIGLAIAFTVLLRRRGLMGWALFLYALSIPAAQDQSAFGAFPLVPYLIATIVIADGIGGFGAAALLLFALRFPDDMPSRGRRWQYIAALMLGVILCCLWTYPDVATTFLARPANAVQTMFPLVATVATLAAAVALIARLPQLGGDTRQRTIWIIAGMLLLPVVRRLAYFLQAVAAGLYVTLQEYILTAWLAAEIIGWFAIAYAVIRYRVVSFSFVVDRAIVFGSLTMIIVATFTVVEWFVGKILDRAELVPAVNLGLVVLFGFWMRGLHGRVEELIERTLFERRHAAERRLERAAATLLFAPDEPTVYDVLVSEPVAALSLASAALFRRHSATNFRRVCAIGWPDSMIDTLGENDSVVLSLQSDLKPQTLNDMRWTAAPLPDGVAHPALAVPISVRRQLVAIALYGPHDDGRCLDPDAIACLTRLAQGAGPAFEHLRLMHLRRRYGETRRKLRKSQTTLRLREEEVSWLRSCVAAGEGVPIE